VTKDTARVPPLPSASDDVEGGLGGCPNTNGLETPGPLEGVSALVLPLTAETYDMRRSVGYLMTCNSKLAVALAHDAFAVEADLGFPQFLVLMLLREGIASTPGDLSRLVGNNSGAITRQIDHMERAGLVERVRSTADRRSIEIVVTQLGNQTVDALLPRLVDLWNDVLKDFDQTEYGVLIQLLEKLLAAQSAVGRAMGRPS
jgi:DNA-binding MarR family transcriptional regulator